MAAGVTAIVCAFVLGERDLLRAGMLVLVLPLLSAVMVARTRYRLVCARRLAPARVPVGHEARVDLRLQNVSRLPSGLLLVEDRVPYALGGRARFVIERIEPQGSRELSYRVRSQVRGRHRVGPLTVRLADPFGLVELVRSFSVADRLTVTPQVVELPAGRPPGGWGGGGDSPARALAGSGEDDVAPREYRHGDDLRRVHWRSTARRGELMVRREERHRRDSGTLLLDTRARAHPGEGPAGSFEQAVSIAASVGVHLSRAGVGLRLVTDAGRSLEASAAFESALLDLLAGVRPSKRSSLNRGLAELTGGGPGENGAGPVIAVLGALEEQEAQALAALRRGAAAHVAIMVDQSGDRRRPSDRAARLLRAAGWQVTVVASAAELPAAWIAADRAPRRQARSSP